MQQAHPEQADTPASDFDYPAEIEKLESKANEFYTLAHYGKAEEVYRRLISLRKDREGIEATHRDRFNLAAALVKQRRFSEAESMLRDVLTFLTSRPNGRDEPNFAEQEAAASALLAEAQVGQAQAGQGGPAQQPDI